MSRLLWFLCCMFCFIFSVSVPAFAQSETEPLTFPVPMPSEDQIAEARACDVDVLAETRYKGMEPDDFADAYPLKTACDYGVLALAYTSSLDEGTPPPEEGTAAYIEAVRLNPALAYALPLLIAYFDVGVVAAPDTTDDPLTMVTISYTYRGLSGTNVDYELVIDAIEADSAQVTGRYTATGVSMETGTAMEEDSGTIASRVDGVLVAALAASLTDLIPSAVQFTQVVCTDNYPDWRVTLTFEAGETVDLRTNGSNLLNAGGPWQAAIDGQNYMQFSSATLQAVLDIEEALNLPEGGTAAMTCMGLGQPPIDDAFPPEAADS